MQPSCDLPAGSIETTCNHKRNIQRLRALQMHKANIGTARPCRTVAKCTNSGPFQNLGSKLLQMLLSQLFTLRCHLCELCCSNWRHCRNLCIPSCFVVFPLFNISSSTWKYTNRLSIFLLSCVLAAGRNSCDWSNGEATAKKTIRTHLAPMVIASTSNFSHACRQACFFSSICHLPL